MRLTPIVTVGLLVTCTFVQPVTWAQIVERERPAAWQHLVPGAAFKDLFLPMPVREGYGRAPWGGANVNPRDVHNGIEDTEWTYWCGFPIRDDDGLYHLFTARWREDHPDGHFGYFDSEIVRATAQDPLGPYRYQDTLGEGHNPELYRSRRGHYIVYAVEGRYFISKSKTLAGPWLRRTYDFHKRERFAFPGYVNFSFAQREDKSFIAVSRRGYIWASPDGEENWYNTSADSVYPKVAGHFEGNFEDPVLWKDEVQYHLIVNDWKGRIAYYMRSLDGFHWKTEPGEAYVPGIARYENGKVSDWFKFERIRFLYDSYQRPTHVYFAVTDVLKHDDLPNDQHNGKLIAIPITTARRLELLNRSPVTANTKKIRIRIKAEEGFDPHTDIDLASLRFGASEEVNYGRGGAVSASEEDGKDLIVTFDGQENGFTRDHWAGKLLGRQRDGQVLFGWVRLPGMVSEVSLLSPLSPMFEFTSAGLETYVEVQNFGTVNSERATVRVLDGDQELARASLRPLRPFEKSIVRMVCEKELRPGLQREITVRVESPGCPTEAFTRKVSLPKQ